MIEHQTHRTGTDFWRKFVRGLTCHSPILSGVGASGKPGAVQSDLSRAAELLPSAYYAVWLDIAEKRSNLPSRLAGATKQMDLSKWPGPVVRLYLGHSTPAELLAAADDANAKITTVRSCQAKFYIAELRQQRGKTGDARALFRSIVAGYPRTLDEWLAANAELGAGGVNP